MYGGHQGGINHHSDQHRFAGQGYSEGPGFTKDFFEDQNLNNAFFDENIADDDHLNNHPHFDDHEKNHGKRNTLPYIHKQNHNNLKLNKGFFDENFSGVLIMMILSLCYQNRR